jgi:hypothetical protein
MPTELLTESRARRLLAVGSWSIVAVFAFALITLIPPLERLSRVGQPLGPVVGTILGIGLAVGMLGTWVGGIWHASVHPAFLTEGHRVTVVLLLLFPYGGMFYYFGYVYWRHRTHVRGDVASLPLEPDRITRS